MAPRTLPTGGMRLKTACKELNISMAALYRMAAARQIDFLLLPGHTPLVPPDQLEKARRILADSVPRKAPKQRPASA